VEGDTMARLQKTSRARFPQDDQNPKTLADFAFIEEGKIAVMTIRQFSQFIDAGRKRTLSEFYQESFDAMKARGTKTLILDLRSNGGGADELGKQLLSYLLDKPFKYYDDLVVNALEFKFTRDRFWQTADEMEHRPDGKYRMVKHPNWGLQEPSKPTFAGKVYILINGGSFSTTAEFLSHIQFHKRATFIGDESGGGYYGNTSGQGINLTLPNTKINVRIPLVSYYLAVGGYEAPAALRGVLPDHPIDYSIEDLLAGKDKELDKALELARQQ
jgi:C-terminal processing protease CtpA/Prc